MNGYIKALRLRIVIMAGLLAMAAFRVSGWDAHAYLVALFIIIAASATMTQNDLRDREHDARKGKSFVLHHLNPFRRMVIAFWLVSLMGASVLLAINRWYGILSGLIILSGLVYSETRKIPLLPTVMVAVTSASPALYANPTNEKVLAIFFVSSLLIFCRELLKDLDDCVYDSGYKRTLPLILGSGAVKFWAGTAVLISPLVALLVSVKTLAGAPFLVLSAFYLILDRDHRSAKFMMDIGMSLIIASLLIGGP